MPQESQPQKQSGLSIVLPTYNERDNIELLIPALEKRFAGVPHEIIVVDDSSPDGTGEAVLKLAKSIPNLKLVTRSEKAGIGAALRDGYNAAANEIILSSDADSFSPEDIMAVYQKVRGGGYSLVVGTRYNSSRKTPAQRAEQSIGLLKKTVSVIGNKLLRVFFRLPVSDVSVNCRAIHKGLWNKIRPRTKDNGNFFLFEMIFWAHKNGARVGEVPITVLKRKHGNSKINKVYVRELIKALHKLTVLLLRK